jgi:Mor family transcriptional regulator
MTDTARTDDDIPSVVEEEMRQARIANIPLDDQPRYVADRIRLRIAGRVEYTRKRAMSPTQRAAEIRSRFTGNNIDELARDFDLTTKRIRQIVNER